MSRYSLGFTISHDVIRMAVVQEKGWGWELKCFVKAVPTPTKPAAGGTVFPDRETLVALLLKLYESPEFAPYRQKIAAQKDKVTVAVGIPGKFAWLHYIPFQSLNDLYNRKLYQQSVDETLRRNIPYPPELLVYDTRLVRDPERPYVYLLASPKKLIEEILGTKEQESVLEQAGFPNPHVVVAEIHGLFTIYPIIAANKQERSIVAHLTAKYLELTILEGTRPCKHDNISVPKLEHFALDDQKFFFGIFVLIHLKMALMYGLWEGKAVQKLVLFGTPPFLSLEQIRDFLQEVLGRKPEQISIDKLRNIFPHKNLDTLLKVCMDRYTQSKMGIPELSRAISSSLAKHVLEKVGLPVPSPQSAEKPSAKKEGMAKNPNVVSRKNIPPTQIMPVLDKYKLNEEVATTIDVTFQEVMEAADPCKLGLASEGLERALREVLTEPKTSASESEVPGPKEAKGPKRSSPEGEELGDYIYQKMIEKEKSILVEIIEPAVIRKFVSKGEREHFVPAAEQLVPLGLAVHALVATEQNLNLAQPLAEKSVSPILQRASSYLPELALNLLVAGTLIYVGLLGLYQQYVAGQVQKIRLEQRQAMANLYAFTEEYEKSAEPIEWRKRSWNQLHVENANLSAAVQFPAVRANKVYWGEAIKEIAGALPLTAVVTSFTFEIGIDDASGEEVPLVHIHGYAPSAARVIEALHQKALSLKEIRLESPVEPQSGGELFVIVGKYLP